MRDRRLVEVEVHRLHDRVEAGEQRGEREQVRQDVDAAPADAVLLDRALVVVVVHGADLRYGSSARIGVGRRDDVADRDARLRRRLEVDVHARAEADEAVALAARERGTRLDVAQDAARDEARDLHAGDVVAVGGAQVQRVALVLERRLVERGVDERARRDTSG